MVFKIRKTGFIESAYRRLVFKIGTGCVYRLLPRVICNYAGKVWNWPAGPPNSSPLVAKGSLSLNPKDATDRRQRIAAPAQVECQTSKSENNRRTHRKEPTVLETYQIDELLDTTAVLIGKLAQLSETADKMSTLSMAIQETCQVLKPKQDEMAQNLERFRRLQEVLRTYVYPPSTRELIEQAALDSESGANSDAELQRSSYTSHGANAPTADCTAPLKR